MDKGSIFVHWLLIEHPMKTGTSIDYLKNIDRTYLLSFVEDEKDLNTKEVALTKEQIFQLFTNHIEVVDKSAPGFIPGTFSTTHSKSEDDIRQISLLVYDLDGKNQYYRLDDLKHKFKGIRCVIHSTYSASYEAPRWRIILFPSENIQPETFDQVYQAVAEKYELDFDPTCKNINRLFYLPTYNKFNDFIQSWFNDGNEIEVKEYSAVEDKRRKNRSSKKVLNRGYVSLSSVASKPFSSDELSQEINGFKVPPALKAPFTQEQFDELLSYPGTWLRAAEYMGLPTNGISLDRTYSRSFSSIIPGVEDKHPSCSLGLLTNSTRLVYLAFNEEHESLNAHGPVKFDLAHIFAMQVCGRRIRQSDFKRGVHKVWLTRLLIESGMIIPVKVNDLPQLPEVAGNAIRLYEGFKKLLMCKRSFISQMDDPTAFSLTFACYWCAIGNRNTAKKYTQLLLEQNVLRFVGRIELPRGGSIPVLLPAGKTARVYHLRNRKANQSNSPESAAQNRPTGGKREKATVSEISRDKKPKNFHVLGQIELDDDLLSFEPNKVSDQQFDGIMLKPNLSRDRIGY